MGCRYGAGWFVQVRRGVGAVSTRVGGGAADAPREPSARARDMAKRLRAEPGRGRTEGWRSYTPARPKRQRARVGRPRGCWARWACWSWRSPPGGSWTCSPVTTPTPPRRPPKPPAPPRRPLRKPPNAPPRTNRSVVRRPLTGRTERPGYRAEGQGRRLDGRGRGRAGARRSRDFLVASSLDPRVLRGERPKKAIALLNPHQKGVQAF